VNDPIVSSLNVGACLAFIIGIKLMGHQRSARLGNAVSAVAMLLAVVAALIHAEVQWSIVAIAGLVGSAVGAVSAVRVKMTAMPELVALFNGLGGLASALVGVLELVAEDHLGPGARTAAAAAIVVGGVAFSGSLIAFGKLAGFVKSAPHTFPGQLVFTALTVLVMLATGVAAIFIDNPAAILIALGMLTLVVGLLAVVRIGGGDMPVVVSLLNSYSGVAATLAGLATGSVVLVVAGTLVGASGLMLTQAMCKAMNRSLTNVLFAGFGAPAPGESAGAEQGTVRPINAPDTYALLEAARSVLIIPGYGMAVAQAQHVVQELAELLEEHGVEVRFVIHPVAGRMPGHMNVLLAEAGVPYENLAEPGDVNPTMETVDVALIIGANDVVNPDARSKPDSPLYGMPIIDADRARTVIVLKRSMSAGFAGVQNSLFFLPNTRMLFGDAKASIAAVVNEFKSD
jgi:NAD(P) transhydrogenase subunit beta